MSTLDRYRQAQAEHPTEVASLERPGSVPDLGPLGIWSPHLERHPMARAQEAVAELDELGFGSLWLPESVGREPFANSALLLSAARRITVATGIASLYSRSAMTMNAGWRTLSEAFPDRFILGIGVSHQPNVEGLFQGTYANKPYSAMVAYLDHMDDSVFLGAAGPQAPRRVLAALGPRMLRLAAERGIGAHTYLVSADHTAEARATLGPDALLVPEQTVVLESDPAVARQVARRFLDSYLQLPNYVNNLRRQGWSEDELGNGGSDALVDSIVAWGSLDQVAARVQAHLDAGADHVCVQVQAQDPRAIPLEQWRELATTVPALRPRS